MTKKRAPRGKLTPSTPVNVVIAPHAFNHLAEALRVYLSTVGWTALVVSDPRVQQQAKAELSTYEFVVRFTGGKMKAKQS